MRVHLLVHVCVVQVQRQHQAGAWVVGFLAVRPLVRWVLVMSVPRLVLLRHQPQVRPRQLLGLLGPLRLPERRLVLASLLLAKLRLAFLLPLRHLRGMSPWRTRILFLASRH